jgi:transposase-like protein
MGMRRKFDAGFKVRVTMEAIATLAELASRYQVHPNQTTKRKKQATQDCRSCFRTGAKGRISTRMKGGNRHQIRAAKDNVITINNFRVLTAVSTSDKNITYIFVNY